MVGAADHALYLAGFLHQLHAAVAADVVEDLHQAFAVTHHQQRQAHEVHGLHIAVLRQVAGETDAGPVAPEHVVPLQFEVALLGIELVGQAVSFMDGSQNGFQDVGGDQAGVSRKGHSCSLLLVARQAWP
ncbi:hypothetical protein D9M71_134550 [compost metagenome]